MLQLAQQLPLIIRDGFDTNDYGWQEFQETFNQGIQCGASLVDSRYSIVIQSTSTSGGAWCAPYSPRSANNFYLSFEAQLVNSRNADILLYYRWTDDYNFLYLVLNPQTQTMTLGGFFNGQENFYVRSQYIPAIHKDQANKITLLTLDTGQGIYINDHLEVLLMDENSLREGQTRIGLRLNEANEIEELQIDNFELRGN
jgi:hypothetical protein